MASVASVAELHRLMERFWLIEEGDSTPCHSVEEAACENHFQSTVSRTDDGRYMVRLPVKQDLLPNLGNNWNTANRRFKYLESKLSRNNDQRIQYVEFMHEYLFLGHMCEVNRAHQLDALEYFMPHHAVIRESSTTTKIRVVFDASCRSASGASLNDILMVGPVVQEDIRSIIMRARKHQIMLIGDIKQMYRQILVDPRDTPMQRIVWRSNSTSPLATFELKTVTYGTASAPFLATRVLQQLADDEQKDFPEAATILKQDFYVDYLFSGAETVEKVISLREQLDALCQRGGFELRKYASNSEAALEGLSDDKRALQSTIEFDENPIIKTLGLHWEPASDVLKYVINLEPSSSDMCLTKRNALSLIARLFDPLGLVAPVVVTAKIYMQVLWTLRDEDSKTWPWDRPLPKDLIIRWNSYYSQLHHLNMLKIERCILVANPTSIQLHLFSDASELAYGACAFDPSGFVKIALITTKSKVAPLQKKSIARIELCGALAAAQLYQKIISSLKTNPETFFWVDSTTVLAWLNSTPSTWSTFVANRVSKIQLATINSHWNHVSGKENPADHLSRGTTAEFLLNCSSWWNGPDWLRFEPEFWPSNNHQKPLTEVAEEKRKTLSLIAAAPREETFLDPYVQRFSDYRKMLRVTAYCMRFIDRFSLKTCFNHPTTNLTVEEIRRAEKNLIRILQEQHFEEEVRCLHDGKQVSAKSKLRWFHPILGFDHLLRIGGRLNKSPRTYDSKHQIILPSTHAFSTLLIRSFHLNHLHAAPQLLLSLLRMRYWVLGARNRARLIVRQCIICFKARPKLVEQFMGELPAARITATRPFAVAGVDYWGPIFLKPVHRRAASEKAFVAVFVCFSTKAVHIELVADLSTAKFIQALRRFVSRRGLCSDMHSDNGRNFLGADNELRRLVNSSSHQQAVNQECLAHGIRWHFNPPKASHFGGLSLQFPTPEEAWSRKKSVLKNLRVFGCKAMYQTPKQLRQKYDPKSEEGIFVGYPMNSKGYRIYNPITKQIVVSRQVIFVNEGKPAKSIPEEPAVELTELFYNMTPRQPKEVNPGADSRSVVLQSEQNIEARPEAESIVVEPDVALPSQLKTRPADDLKGRGTAEEMNALAENETWELTDLPPGRTAIRNKWDFKINRDSDGRPGRCKARLVIKGCSQRLRIDYSEVYAPVVRYCTVRYLMALAVQHDLEIEQMDAVTAFLQGKLSEDIYMEQPEGFNDGSSKVCRLKRALNIWPKTIQQGMEQPAGRSVAELWLYPFEAGSLYAGLVKHARHA
ncbi:uncharacterized protein LOC129752819 [Uranotaenia lowii]|uniref:uncharacterized protein LOC129752819 n=1 Tax=Uranotaenia lowii TaxID=190385 RepID=UPI0024791DEF|nr:uncharacterized protein LOC129752819 [Uranotaenia lowii]